MPVYATCFLSLAIALTPCGISSATVRATTSPFSIQTQTVQDGTGRVVELARDFVGNRPFILAYGDILVDPANYKRLVDLPDDVEAMLTVTRGEDVSQRRRGVSQ